MSRRTRAPRRRGPFVGLVGVVASVGIVAVVTGFVMLASDGSGSARPVVVAPIATTTLPPPTTTVPPTTTTTEPDPQFLPQTDATPNPSSAKFQANVAALWQAIATDDPDLAMGFFFPLGAYRQVKGISDPDGDWKNRLVAQYVADIHALHARLGDQAATAQYVGIDVPDGSARWVLPGEEYNKGSYWRVYDAMLRYTAGGRAGAFDVKSMISWRGEWYVVHLIAVK
ncbi:MAG: hypothetical protein WCI50_01715 [Actinomycetes bacterium]